jgi:hypothetical protein
MWTGTFVAFISTSKDHFFGPAIVDWRSACSGLCIIHIVVISC